MHKCLFENTRIVRYNFSFDLAQTGIMDIIREVPNKYDGLDFVVFEVPGNSSMPRIVITKGNNGLAT